MALTESQQIFVVTFLEQARLTGDYRTAGLIAKKAAGYSENMSVSNIVSSEGVKQAILDQVNSELIQMIPKALHGLEEVMDQPALPGAKNAIAAASTILDRAGVIKVDKQEITVKDPNAVLILPAKQKVED